MFLARIVIPRSFSSSPESMTSSCDVLSRAEGAALLEQRVDERRLAVVDVRDDGERASIRATFERRGIFGFDRHGFHIHSFSFAARAATQAGERTITP